MLHKKNKRYEKDRTYLRALHCFSSLSCGLHRCDAGLKADGHGSLQS